MPLGRKKTESQVPSSTFSSVPTGLSGTRFTLPSGDRYSQSIQNGQLTSEIKLSGASKKLVKQSQSAMQTLGGELMQPDATRAAQIQSRADDFYGSLSDSLLTDASYLAGQTKSDLSKRFGGAYNATFGTDLLARQQNNLLGQLVDARSQANLMGEDLFQADEASRINRYNLFSNTLNGFNNMALDTTSLGTNFLNAERSRSMQAALSQSQANANAYQSMLARQQQMRQQALDSYSETASKVAQAAAMVAFV